MEGKVHLTLDERNFIEQELAKNASLREIASHIEKSTSTISREIFKHRIKKDGQAIHVNFNQCAKKFNCHRHNLCNPVVLKNVDIVIFVTMSVLTLLKVLVLD